MSSTKIQKALESGKRVTIVESARGPLNSEYESSNVKRQVPSGMTRVDMDVRPIGNSDAIFKNYDYAGEDAPGPNKPSLGMYSKMSEYDSAEQYIEKDRLARENRTESDLKTVSKSKKKKDKKRVDMDTRPYPNPIFTNYDYTDADADETSPGGGFYHGIPGGGKSSVKEWVDDKRKQMEKRKKTLSYYADKLKNADIEDTMKVLGLK